MKKNLPSFLLGFTKVIIVCLSVFLFSGNVKAQILAEWPLLKTTPLPPLGAYGSTNVASGVSANVMTFNRTTFGSPSPFLYGLKYGLKIKQINVNWPSKPNPYDTSYAIDFPITPDSAHDITITGLTLEDSVPYTSISSNLILAPYYQIDSAGAWVPLAAPQLISLTTSSFVTFGKINTPFFINSVNKNVHNYRVRFCLYSPNAAVRTDYFYLSKVIFYGTVQPATIPPNVTTGTPIDSGKYTITGTGTYSYGNNYQIPTIAGITWSTSANPNIATSPYTTDDADGVINASNITNITGLSAGTLYHVRAYVVTTNDTIYGQDLSVKTAPTTIPSITTSAAINVLSVKAIVGGNILDSGGVSILQKGVCWSKVSGKETVISGTSFTNEGSGSASFSSIIPLLQPSTTYFVKAYAINSLGIAYGEEISFTTSAAVPVLSAVPSNISFENSVLNSNAVRAFVLSGAQLSPASGIITITPPTGFSVSLSGNGGFVTAPATLSIPYNYSRLKTIVYVKQTTSSYGIFTGFVTVNGGGTVNPNIDTVALSGSVIQDPTLVSNLGTDFWVGYGMEERMTHSLGSSPDYGLQLYVASGAQEATVKVSLPGIPAFIPQYVTIPPNSVQIISGFPIGDGSNINKLVYPDCRLNYTGISNRGIHIEATNNAPVAVFLYDYATNNSAGGSMVLPTNAWNSSYMVQTYGGAGSNSGVPNSYFFVIAKENNTVVAFKPTAPIIDSITSASASYSIYGGTVAYAANSTYQIILNKGQVFNALGMVDPVSKLSYDLTGTNISSDCNHPIAVFAGNSRTLINTPGLNCVPIAGSDNLIQQMFPKVAWGTKYLTSPTKTMEYNIFRIAVQDTNTVVKVDDSILTKATLNTTGMYYEVEGNKGKKIESDIPVSVSQFIISGNACGGASIGNKGTGDPEMILLSPVQQAIKSTTVYTSDFKDGSKGGTYINVIIPTSGVASFKLDSIAMVDTGTNSYTIDTMGVYGTSSLIPIANAFVPFPNDSSYSYARFHVSYPAVHTLSSTIGFNAIAYGVANGESWGYNAGTSIKDISTLKIIENPYGSDTSTSAVYTGKNNSVTLKIALPYSPSQVDSIVWSAPKNSNINLSGTTITGALMVDPKNAARHYADTSGTILLGEQKFHVYSSPVKYQFSDYGLYPMVATAYGSFVGGCGGSDAQKINVLVGSDGINFKAIPAGCGSTKVSFVDSSIALPGSSIVKWIWNLGDGTMDSSTNVASHNPTINPHTYAEQKAYSVKLTTINSLGYTSTDSMLVDLTFGVSAKFGMDKDSICAKNTLSFFDSSTTNAVTWHWDFGEPSSSNNTSTLQNPTHSYQTVGKHIVSLQVATIQGCISTKAFDTVFVSAIPKAAFTATSTLLTIPDTIAFTNKSDTTTTGKLTYQWNFGDGGTSTSKDPTHIYNSAPPLSGDTVRLTATSMLGCSDIASLVLTNNPLPLRLTNITASEKTGFVAINWSTATEVNTSHFIVQHSNDGISFSPIGSVIAIGSGANGYQFIDNTPSNGKNYYRLSIIDNNGKVTFSKTVTVQISIANYKLSIIPNPARDFTTINFGKRIDKATIVVYNLTGKAVITHSVNGSSSYKLNTQSLANGVYVIKVNTSTDSFKEKLLINK